MDIAFIDQSKTVITRGIKLYGNSLKNDYNTLNSDMNA